MKIKLLFLVPLVLITFKVTSQTGWYNLTSGTTNQLYSVFFTSDSNGYVVGRNGTILLTTDGGNVWDTAHSPTSAHLYSVFFVDNTTGYAVSGQSIIKTSNSGSNWALQNTTKAGNSVFFPSSYVGYVVGDYGAIVKTISASITWLELTSGTSEDLKAVYFINDDVGIAVGNNGTIIKTTDAGITWSPKNSGTDYNLMDVKFVNSTTCYTVGTKTLPQLTGIILKSTDAGNTWSKIDSVNYELEGMSFPTADTGYIFGFDPSVNKGLILKTINAGSSWTKQTSSTNQTLFDGYFLNGNLGYAVGVYGTIIKTTTGGETSGIGIKENNGNPGDLYIQINPNPVTESSKINFTVNSNSTVTVKILDISGKEVVSLMNNERKTGSVNLIWDRTNNSGSLVKAGLYFCELLINHQRFIQKILVLSN